MKRLLIIGLLATWVLPIYAAGKKLQMELPGEFAASAEQIPVHKSFWTHAKVPMTFGSFQVTEHHRGWENHRSASTPVTPPWFPVRAADRVRAGKSSTNNSYQFTLAANGTPRWRAGCVTRTEGEDITVAGIPISSTASGALVCSFANVADESRIWTLTVRESASLASFRSVTNGELTDGATTLKIEPVTKYEGSTFTIPGAIGFTISEKDVTVGAVDIGGVGLVYLAPGSDEEKRALLAASFSAILLNEE